MERGEPESREVVSWLQIDNCELVTHLYISCLSKKAVIDAVINGRVIGKCCATLLDNTITLNSLTAFNSFTLMVLHVSFWFSTGLGCEIVLDVRLQELNALRLYKFHRIEKRWSFRGLPRRAAVWVIGDWSNWFKAKQRRHHWRVLMYKGHSNIFKCDLMAAVSASNIRIPRCWSVSDNNYSHLTLGGYPVASYSDVSITICLVSKPLSWCFEDCKNDSIGKVLFSNLVSICWDQLLIY